MPSVRILLPVVWSSAWLGGTNGFAEMPADQGGDGATDGEGHGGTPDTGVRIAVKKGQEACPEAGQDHGEDDLPRPVVEAGRESVRRPMGAGDPREASGHGRDERGLSCEASAYGTTEENAAEAIAGLFDLLSGGAY